MSEQFSLEGADRGRGFMAHLGRVIALFLALSAPAHSLSIHLHDAEVQHQNLLLGDIAVFGGVTNQAADQLAGLQIGYAPVPGRSKVIPVETIRLAAMRLGYLPTEISVIGSASRVYRRSQIVGIELISSEVEAAIKKNIPSDAEISIQRLTEPPMLPEGRIQISVEVPKKLERTIVVPVVIKVAEQSVRINAVVRITRPGRVIQANRRIERGEIIRAEDISEKIVDLYEVQAGSQMLSSEIIGLVASRTIAPHSIITSSSIEKLKLIKRGDSVNLKVSIPGIEISIAGSAYESGALGEIIRVKNISSGKIISGRVTGAGEVIIVE